MHHNTPLATEISLEVLRTERECLARIQHRLALQFQGLDYPSARERRKVARFAHVA